MPIYEFKCSVCGKEFEKLCPVGKDRGVRCPECGASKTERLFSVFGVRSSGRTTGTSGSKSSCSTCGDGSCSICD
ncbi:MAG: zinc ribbon domain-containing protein [Candidatus Eisenbacteria bacterium]|nr:zinc ribbon domain-containing protein [Candidatus Eisenbacteria bacterium]